VGVSHHTVRLWLTRFVDLGVAGLNDMPRPGARRQYDAAIVADVVGIARSSPRDLGLPVARWTLDGLVAYLQACRGISIKRSRLSEVLQAASVDWRQSNEEAADATNDRSRQASEPALVTSRRPSVNRRVRTSIRRRQAGDDRVTPSYASSVRPRKDGGSVSLGRGPSRWRAADVDDVPEQAT
jgi:transposase